MKATARERFAVVAKPPVCPVPTYDRPTAPVWDFLPRRPSDAASGGATGESTARRDRVPFAHGARVMIPTGRIGRLTNIAPSRTFVSASWSVFQTQARGS